MNIRKTLIIITTILILIGFTMVSSISYNLGMNYGVDNAEKIRKSRSAIALEHKKSLKTVQVREVTNADLNTTIKSSGRVVSLSNITISSEVGGKLEGNFSLKKGTKFSAGDILFSVKNTDMKLLLDAKKSNFMRLLSSLLADIKIDFPDQYSKWDHYFNAISLNSPIADIPETATSKEKNFIISKGLMAEYLSLKSDEEKLKKYSVRATFDGVISKTYTDKGASVNMGSPIIDVIKIGDMEVELSINTNEVNQIKIGGKVLFTDGTNQYNGIINRIGSFVNENTQSISVFAVINKDTERLYNGMYLDASIISEKIAHVMRIPRRAIFSSDKIFIVNGENKIEEKQINIVTEDGQNVIIDNLSDKTLVVIEPLINTKAGTKVNTIIK